MPPPDSHTSKNKDHNTRPCEYFHDSKTSVLCGVLTFMQECLSLLRPEVRVLVAEDELDGIEKVGLARPVPANDYIVSRVEGLDDRLLTVGLEPLDDHLLDVHLEA